MHTNTSTEKLSPRIKLGDREIKVNRLHLDSNNPRHKPMESDSDVISELCTNALVAELAKDIASRGSLSPLDKLGVIPHEKFPGHFIAVEGNRRACALLLLSNPSLAPTPALQAQLQSITEKFDVPKTVNVHVFAGRSEAKQWIDLRHLGEQGGVGTKKWTSDQKTRASRGSSITSSKANTLALSVLDRLSNINLLTPEKRTQVSLTTITRYLGTPGVRAIIGLGDGTDLIYTHDVNEVDNALQKLIIDSIESNEYGKIEVTSRSNSAGRLSYATKLQSLGIAPVTPLENPVAPPQSIVTTSQTETIDKQPAEKANSIQTKAVEAPKEITKKRRNAPNPATLPTLFSRSFIVTNRDPVLLRLREEATKLELETFPFSGNYLLRAFIEQVMVLFAKKRGRFTPEMKDDKLTQVCAAELTALGTTGKALTVINKAAGSSATPYSLHSLGHVVHGGAVPTRQSLRAASDTWLPSLQAMLDHLQEEQASR